MIPKWLIVLACFAVAAGAAQYSATLAPLPESRLPVMSMTMVEPSTLTSTSRPSAGSANVVGYFPGTGQGLPSVLAPCPPHVYLPLIIKPTWPTVGGGVELEPDDTHLPAVPFEVSCYAGPAMWSSDLDWYQSNLCAAALGLRLNLNGPASADIDLELYGNPPGNPLGASEGLATHEVITTGPRTSQPACTNLRRSPVRSK